MIKMIVLLKRKAGLTRDQFIARYEGGHAKLAEKHLTNAVRYVRRYLEPLPELFTGDTIEPEHDVITEVWFENQEQYEIAMKRLAQPEVVAEIVEDEETLFERDKHRVFMVDERDSACGQTASAPAVR